ncbi:MAG: nitrile hydratase [Limisphaerales bacterium]|jgi:nitrile hydratase
MSSEAEIRAEALEALLVEKGILDPSVIDDVIQRYNERVGPMNGARVVAKAWLDPEFKARLLEDGTQAIADFEFEGGEVQKLKVIENTDAIHNVVVCTLCSCYPWALLGLPPKWYKDPAYRSRIVKEPRTVLGEFGTDINAQRAIRVWDSSAEIRYLVLPRMPQAWQGQSEQTLTEQITRNSMIGVEE